MQDRLTEFEEAPLDKWSFMGWVSLFSGVAFGLLVSVLIYACTAPCRATTTPVPVRWADTARPLFDSITIDGTVERRWKDGRIK